MRVLIDVANGRVKDPDRQQRPPRARQHRTIHEAFAAGAEWAGIAGFVEWMYAELVEMPLGDPALGLDVPDPFTPPPQPALVARTTSILGR